MIHFEIAEDVRAKVVDIVSNIGMPHILLDQVICFRSSGSKSRALARCWEFPRIWQLALDKPPHYVIEVISEKYDKLSTENKEKVLIHELMHIPNNFSGHLRPHGKILHRTLDRKIDKLHQAFKQNKGYQG